MNICIYMKCDRNPAEKWGKPVTKKITLICRIEGQVFSQVPETIPAKFLDWFVPIGSCFTAFWIDYIIKTSNPCWTQKAPTLGICSSKQFWELRADQKLKQKENTWLLILTRPDPDWRQQVDSTPNSRADPLEEGHLRDSWYMLFSN